MIISGYKFKRVSIFVVGGIFCLMFSCIMVGWSFLLFSLLFLLVFNFLNRFLVIIVKLFLFFSKVLIVELFSIDIIIGLFVWKNVLEKIKIEINSWIEFMWKFNEVMYLWLFSL